MDRYIAGPRSASGQEALHHGHARLVPSGERATPHALDRAATAAALRTRPRPTGGRAASPGRAPALAGSCAEDGFSLVETLVAAALVSMAMVGAAVIFSAQAHVVSQTMAPGGLQDAVAAVDVDANAVQAYDPAARQAIMASGQQLWTVDGAGGDPIVMQAQPAANGLSVVAKRDNQAASVVAPLPAAKPLPQ
jgi:prepilin-type N-terminal cleavage/methylation domain-containing protein